MNSQRPNILYMISHDLGRHLGCYGKASVESPALDGLGAEGALFTNSFCTAPSCSPSRGSLITGRYPHSNGLMGLVNNGWDLPESERTLPQYMKEAGYETALFGFQHERIDPYSFGYDHTFCLGLSSCDSRSVAPAVIEFLNQKHRTRFFINAGFNEVHRPYLHPDYPPADPDSVEIPPYLPDRPGVREQLAGLDGLIKSMDSDIGRIMAALDSSGLKDNTLVIFTTDHGIDMPLAKGTLYDPGIETTLIMRWPEGFDGARKLNGLVSHVDVLPTLLDILGINPPDRIQGKSFLPVLRGDLSKTRAEIFAEKTHHSDYDPMRCVRTERHKFIHNFGAYRRYEVPADPEMDVAAIMPEVFHVRRPVTELYDLENDPLERNNLSGSQETRAIEEELRERLLNWMRETKDPLLEGAIPLPWRIGADVSNEARFSFFQREQNEDGIWSRMT